MRQASIDPFQAVADPSRRQILHLLSKDSLTINALAENFDMSRPAVSKHVKILYMAGFLTIEDIGRERYCVLNQDGFNKLQDWINEYDKFWKTKLKALENFLDKKAKK
jgi:DNA-binding transcriptional ArsR family regulator